MRAPISPQHGKPSRTKRIATRSMRLDAAHSLHPLARKRMHLVEDAVPNVSVARTTSSTRGDGHLIEVASGAHATLRPRPIPADGASRHHIVQIGGGARVDLLLDDLCNTSSPSRSAEIWVGPKARLRIVDRACAIGKSLDLTGLRVSAGATVELVSLRRGAARSSVVSADLGPGAKVSLTWLQSTEKAEVVDLRIRGAGHEARHTLLLSAPLGPGPGVVRLEVSSDRAGVPSCESIQMGAPTGTSLPGWSCALSTIGIHAPQGTVELPPIPPSLRTVLQRRSQRGRRQELPPSSP